MNEALLMVVGALRNYVEPDLIKVVEDLRSKAFAHGRFMLHCENCGCTLSVESVDEIKKHQASCAKRTLLKYLDTLEGEIKNAMK